MNFVSSISLVALWLFVPAIWYASIVLRVRRLRREREHDQILYAFCATRDTVASRVARCELDQRSQIFRYFYCDVSRIIHDHKRHPIGFAHIAKSLESQRNRPPPIWVVQLLRELKKGDAETREMVFNYIRAIELVMKQDPLIVFLDRLIRCFRVRGYRVNALSRWSILPPSQKIFTRFNQCLAEAAGFRPLGLIPDI